MIPEEPMLGSKVFHSQEQFWSEHLKKDPCFLSRSSGTFDEDLIRYARELCTGLKGAVALEIGCGDGSDAVGMVQQYGLKGVTAIDIAGARVGLAQETVRRAGLNDQIQVLQMDAHQLDFPNHHFDVVYCNSVLLFLNRDRFFLEVVRILKPGGRLILFRESLDGNPLLAAYRALWPARWKRDAEKFANRLSVREIEEVGRLYFASVEHQEFYLFFSILARLGPWLLNRVFRGRVEYTVNGREWARALDGMLLRRYPSLRRFAWITVACFTSRR